MAEFFGCHPGGKHFDRKTLKPCFSEACAGANRKHNVRSWFQKLGEVLVIMPHTIDATEAQFEEDSSIVGREQFEALNMS